MNDPRFERLRPAEIVAEMRQCPLVFVAVGPLEWHGPHLPLSTDPLIAYGVALRVATRVGGVVLPPLYMGTERERTPEQLRSIGFSGGEWIVGMDFPANILKSLYYREEFFAVALREILTLLGQQGYRLIVIVNGHGAANHLAVLKRLALEFNATGPARVLNFVAWAGDESETMASHAGSTETSRMMALYPETVDLSKLPPVGEPLRNVDWGIVDGPTFDGHPTSDFTTRDDPRIDTSAERGEKSLELSTAHIAAIVDQALVEMGYPVQVKTVGGPRHC